MSFGVNRWVLGLAFSIFFVSTAWAARLGTIDADQVQVHEQPSDSSPVVDQPKKGASVTASNYAVQGFYKVRLQSGVIGWVAMSSLSLEPMPSAQAIMGTTEREHDGTFGPENSKSKRSGVDMDLSSAKVVRFVFLGGFDFYSLTSVVNNSTLGGGYHFGGEFVWSFSQRFGFVVRVDYIFNTAVLTDSLTNYQYQVGISSLPVTAGLAYTLPLGKKTSLGLGLMGGVATPTGITSSLETGPNAGSAASLSAFSPAFLARLQFGYQMSANVSVLVEGGYRYLISPSLVAVNTVGTAAGILQSSFQLNLSGPLLGAALALSF